MSPSVGALRNRRAGYARYAELIVAQIEALDADDLDRFRALADERDELARRIDAGEELAMADLGALAAGDAGDDAALEVERLLGEVRLLLEQCREHDARLREKLGGLRDATRDSIHDLERRKPRVRGYMQPAAGRQARVDVRL